MLLEWPGPTIGHRGLRLCGDCIHLADQECSSMGDVVSSLWGPAEGACWCAPSVQQHQRKLWSQRTLARNTPSDRLLAIIMQ